MGELCSICEKEIEKCRVSVCLSCAIKAKQKSVSFEWLEKYCDEHAVTSGFGIMPFIFEKDLLLAAKKEAGKR